MLPNPLPYFEELKDPRRETKNKLQTLSDIVMIVLWAVEIPAIPDWVSLLDIAGAVVSIEAMGCQKALAQTIVEAKADYVLALKDNHKERCEAGSRYFCESLFWASQPKQAAKITRPLLPAAPQPSCSRR